MSHSIGLIALNISTLIYMVVYLPQLWHNHQHPHLEHMSFGFHALLLLGAIMDLYNAFGIITQWQYQLVGSIYVICLLIQHLQWLSIARKKQCMTLHHITSLCATALLIGLMYPPLQQSSSWCLGMAWLARLAFISYSIPQIINNHVHPNNQAIAIPFLYLSMITYGCDSIAAIALHWGAPNACGALICLCLNLILWGQHKYHGHSVATTIKGLP